MNCSSSLTIALNLNKSVSEPDILNSRAFFSDEASMGDFRINEGNPVLRSVQVEETYHTPRGFVKRYASCKEILNHDSQMYDIDNLFRSKVSLHSSSERGEADVSKCDENQCWNVPKCVPMDVENNDFPVKPGKMKNDNLTLKTIDLTDNSYTMEYRDVSQKLNSLIDLTKGASQKSLAATDIATTNFSKRSYCVLDRKTCMTQTSVDKMSQVQHDVTDYNSGTVKESFDVVDSADNFRKRVFKKLTQNSQQDEKITESEIFRLTSKREQSSVFVPVVCILSLVAVCFYFRNFTAVNSDVQLHNIKTDLLTKVFKQDKVVETIVRVLEMRPYWKSKTKVLGLVGTQGVGKTHVTNIIRTHFPRNLVHELHGPHIGYKSQRDKVIDSINNCCLNLVIVDDMRKEDDIELYSFIHSLPRKSYILVLPIFTLPNDERIVNSTAKYDYITYLQGSLENSRLNYELVVFNEFNEDQVKTWVKQQLKFLKVHPDSHESIAHEILVGHNARCNGLKGLSKKMLLEIERHR